MGRASLQTNPVGGRRKLTCPACAARRAAGLAPLERTLGFVVIEWLEAMLVHGPGDVQGEPYRLDDELKHALLHLYELDAHGRRVVRRGFLSRPKGRSKTELAGAISAAELCGPVRYDGAGAKGEPIGRPVKGAQVVAYATEEGQAGTTYSTAAFMLGEGPAAHEYGLDVGLSRTYLEGGGVMLAETSGATSAEGGRTTFAVFDETAYWATRELRRLHATVRRNLGKRAMAEAWSFETSAAWQPGEESVAEVLYRHWSALAAEGAADPTIYVDHRQAPEVPELDDDDELEAALAARVRAGGGVARPAAHHGRDTRPADRPERGAPFLAQSAVDRRRPMARARARQRASRRRRNTRARRHGHARVRRLAHRRRYRARGLHARRRRRGW